MSKRGARSAWRPEFVEIAERFITMTNADSAALAYLFGVSRSTWHSWVKTKKELAKAVQRARK